MQQVTELRAREDGDRKIPSSIAHSCREALFNSSDDGAIALLLAAHPELGGLGGEGESWLRTVVDAIDIQDIGSIGSGAPQ